MPELITRTKNIFEMIGEFLLRTRTTITTEQERQQAFEAFQPVINEPVRDSEFIRNISYDPTTLVCTIEMEDGDGVWQYYNVRPQIADGLLNAPSRGEYFNNMFVKGFIPYRRIA